PPASGSQHRLVFDLAAGGETGTKPLADANGARDIDPRVPLPVRKPRQLSLTVMIDPGHGGVDSGTVSSAGDNEKTIVLDVGRKLKDVLKKKGYRVAMTRNSDVYQNLKERVAMARSAKADLFISLHADSNSNHELRGVSVYTLSDKASDEETAELARKENRSDVIGDADLSKEADDTSFILIDMSMSAMMDKSSQFARLLTAEFSDCAPLLRNPHRFAGFRVLKAPDVPSVLIELGQLGNSQDEERLIDDKAQTSLAAAMGRAVDRFFAVDRRASLK
ncbi:MAG: N-acetylmuramoyl-L-alanine amidase, partial [Alphaproteobacteria bacterium]